MGSRQARLGYQNAPGHPDITDSWGDLSQTLMHKKWFIVDSSTRAVPTTDWWTSLIDQQYSGNLWAYPGLVNATSTGLYVEFPKTYVVASDGGTAKMQSRSRLTIGGIDFAPQSALARRWGAWTLDWIMQDAADVSRPFAVTIGHGLPFTWVETTKVTPTISVDSATFFNDTGAPLTLPFTGDHFGIRTKGDAYGIFAPTGTQFTVSTAGVTSTIKATFTTPNGYLVVGTLPRVSDLATFNTYAYTVPRDSKVSWTYNEPTAKMTSTWELVNVNLRGGTSSTRFRAGCHTEQEDHPRLLLRQWAGVCHGPGRAQVRHRQPLHGQLRLQRAAAGLYAARDTGRGQAPLPADRDEADD